MGWDLLGAILVPFIWVGQTLIGYQERYSLFGTIIAGVATVLILTVFVRGLQNRLKERNEVILSLLALFLLVTHLIGTAGILLAGGGFSTESHKFGYSMAIIVVDALLATCFLGANKNSDAVASTLWCTVLSFGAIGLSVYHPAVA